MIRVFIVGSGRCGTTLLQSRLSLHSKIFTVSEIGFFRQICPSPPQLSRDEVTSSLPNMLNYLKRQTIYWSFLPLQRLGYTNQNRLHRAYELLARQTGKEDFRALAGKKLFDKVSKHTENFSTALDALALANGNNVWVEQTPSLLDSVEIIEKYLSGAKFIQLVRSWPDVAASYYDAAKKYKDTAWNNYSDLNRIVTDLNMCINRTRLYSNKSNYKIVQYEELIKNPLPTLSSICEFIGIPFEEQLLNVPKKDECQIVHSHEVYKFGIFESFTIPENKFQKVFSQQQQEYILQHLNI